MTDKNDNSTPSTTEGGDDAIEDRLRDLEDEIGDVDLEDITERMDAIEHRQRELQTNIDTIVERAREDEEATPHIRTVERLYTELQALEEQMVDLSAQLTDLTDEDE